jgi:hypothetical protein
MIIIQKNMKNPFNMLPESIKHHTKGAITAGAMAIAGAGIVGPSGCYKDVGCYSNGGVSTTEGVETLCAEIGQNGGVVCNGYDKNTGDIVIEGASCSNLSDANKFINTHNNPVCSKPENIICEF